MPVADGTLPVKKTTLYEERDEEKREVFLREIEQYAPEDLVWVDESGIDEHQYRPWARAPRGERVYWDIPGKRVSRTSLISAYNEGLLKAPMRFKGYTNTVWFNAWLKQCLLPVLKPGQVVIMDNASFHKSEETRRLIESKGCRLLFQPPYSPDLNKIEPQWANVKHAIQSNQNPHQNFFQKLDQAILNIGNHMVI